MDCDYNALSLDYRGAGRRPASFSFHATALCSSRSRQVPAFSTARGMGSDVIDLARRGYQLAPSDGRGSMGLSRLPSGLICSPIVQ